MEGCYKELYIIPNPQKFCYVKYGLPFILWPRDNCDHHSTSKGTVICWRWCLLACWWYDQTGRVARFSPLSFCILPQGSTQMRSLKHHVTVTEELVTHIVALWTIFWPKNRSLGWFSLHLCYSSCGYRLTATIWCRNATHCQNRDSLFVLSLHYKPRKKAKWIGTICFRGGPHLG